MISRFFRSLWGDLSADEAKKFGILSAAIMLILGNYWMLRTTKDPLFNMLVGYRQWQPVAKMFSLFCMVFIVLGYSKLVDLLKKQKLIYIICSFYGVAFMSLAYLVANPDFASLSETSALYPVFSWIPGKAIGWFAYVLLESYGSLVVALFYSFVASVMTTGSAKKGYGVMAFFTQVGTVTGVLISMNFVKRMGIPMLYALGGVIILMVPLVIKLYLKTFPEDADKGESKPGAAKKKTGFFEGLRLILSKPYIMGIFIVVTFYEIISTIVEYQMNWIAVGIYPSKEAFTVFRSYQALGINVLAMIFALLGTSFFMRRFGLRFCLTAFPLTIGAVVLANFLIKGAGVDNYFLMWVLMSATIAIKGLNYALNKPTSEVMYIPTSKDVKFKSKGWIDMFGNRSTKGMGSAVSKSLGYSFPVLILFGTVISLGIVAFWFFIARFVGNKFDKLQKENTIIE